MRLLKDDVEGTKLRAIFASSPDAITVSDLNGNIVDCNQAALDMFGFSSIEELIGKSGFEWIAKKDHQRAMDDLKKILEQGPVKNIQYRCLTKDGHEFPAELSASVIKDSSGKPTGFVAVTKDITERKRTEEALRESEGRYRELTESIDDVFFAMDKDLRYTYWNKASEKLTGISAKDAIGKSLTEIFRDVKGTRVEQFYLDTLRTQQSQSFVNEYQLGDKDFVFEISAYPSKDGLSVFVKDITERKRMEEALSESEEKFRSIFESANDWMIFLDQSGRILDVNGKAVEAFGGSKKELLGKHFAKAGIFSPKDLPTLLSAFAKVLAGKHTALDIHIKNKKGQEILLECSASLMKIDDKFTGMLVIARDITVRKRAEDALRKSENKSRTLLENLPQKIFFKDKNSIYISSNENYARDLKIKSDEIAGRTDYDFYPKKLAEKYRADDKRIMESGETEDIEEEYIQDGLKVFVHTVKTPVKDENGNVVGILGIFWDITERKRAEEELVRLSSAVKMSTDSIVISDLDGKIIDVNEANLKMYNTNDKRDLIGKNSFDLIAPEEREKALAGAKDVLEKGYLKGREYHIVTKDGGRIPVEMSVTIMKDADGKPMGFVGISRDIKERKMMEEKLRESEERFRNLYESIKDPVVVYIGREGHLIQYNEAFKEQTGYTDEELKNKTFLDLVHPGDRALVLEKYRTRYTEEEFPLVYEIRALNKKGEVIPLEISVSPYRVKGKVVGVEAIGRDITERKQMEEKLRQYSEHLEELVQKRTEELLESEKRYSVLVEEANDGVLIAQDEKVILVNKRLLQICGYSRQEIIMLPFEKLVDEKYRQLVKERYELRLQGERVPTTYEIKMIAKSGERVPTEVSAAHTNYQGRPATLVILRDIRERKRMEEQHLKLEKLAAIGELATMVGHDLRNPLQSIENATYYLNNELPRLPPFTPIPPKALEMLQIINDSVNYADKIVRDLHDFSATKKPILKKTNINTIVKETLSQVKTPENVKLTTELGHLPEIKADRDMIKRAFLNLAMNGIQAMEKGGTLKVSTKKIEEFIEISFKDTGVGMSREDMKKLFTPFFTTRAKGMGMGLPICKKFVEIHGGTIEVESEEEKGSTFTVKLPIQQGNGGETNGER